jgi:predicted ATPase with chaperone activity
MAGSPGSGKALLACALPGILPEMSIEESLDVMRIYASIHFSTNEISMTEGAIS